MVTCNLFSRPRFSPGILTLACALAVVLLSAGFFFFKGVLKPLPDPVEAPVSAEAPLPDSPAPEPRIAVETPGPTARPIEEKPLNRLDNIEKAQGRKLERKAEKSRKGM